MSKYRIKNTAGMFNLIKGLTLLGVMMGHTYGYGHIISGYESIYQLFKERNLLIALVILFLNFLRLVGMPALFIISGYGFRKSTTKECIKRQWKLLLKPYLIVVIISSIISFFSCVLWYRSFSYGIKTAFKIFLGGIGGVTYAPVLFGIEVIPSGPIWYLMTLAIAYVLFNILAKFFDGKKLLVASIIAELVGVAFYFIFPPLPWCITQSISAVMYIYLGYIAKKKKLFTEMSNRLSNHKLLYIPIVLALLSFYVLVPMFESATETFGLIVLSDIGYTVVAFFWIYFLLFLNRFNGRISNFIRDIGVQTLYVLCIHNIEYMTIGGLLQVWLFENWRGATFARVMITFSVRAVVVLLLTFGYVWVKDKLSMKKV